MYIFNKYSVCENPSIAFNQHNIKIEFAEKNGKFDAGYLCSIAGSPCASFVFETKEQAIKCAVDKLLKFKAIKGDARKELIDFCQSLSQMKFNF